MATRCSSLLPPPGDERKADCRGWVVFTTDLETCSVDEDDKGYGFHGEWCAILGLQQGEFDHRAKVAPRTILTNLLSPPVVSPRPW
jgi:hypothetical protein